MAEEIRLVGSFQDNITNKLKKLNREINNVTKSFDRFGKKLRPISKEMGRLAMSSERVATSLKAQRQSLNATTQAMRAYTTASRKAATQQRKMRPARVPSAPAAPRGGGAGVPAGGPIGMTGASLLTGGAVFGQVVGQQFGAMIMQGMGMAFDMYKGILAKPFTFIAEGIGERINDEMEDIKAAGGIYSISKRMDNPMVRTFAEAESLTKETNRYLAELAGALPGDTQQYIQVARQISDSIGLIISNDRENAIELGQKLAEGRGADTKAFQQGGQAAVQAAFKEMTGELTKQTVLAGGGGASAMGAMGLPQLSERMISTQDLSVNMFRRYSAIFRDPQIMGALERNMEKINATTKGTVERYEAIQAMYAEVVTPEYVRRVQRSTEGVLEALKTTFMNPEVGLLGLGRPIELGAKASNELSIKFDSFGRMLDKNNKVTTDVTQAARESLSVFEYLRDIFANVMIVMESVIAAGAQMISPFKDMGMVLDGIRNATMKFQRDFEAYRVGLENAGDKLDKGTIPLRAALNTVNNLFANMGVYTEKEFQALAQKLGSADFTDFGTLIPKMVNDFLTSKFAVDFGAKIGEVFGTILKSFTDILLDVTGGANVENLFTGFIKGFEKAGGVKAAEAILNKLVSSLFEIFKFMVSNFPFQTFLAGLVLLGPALVTGLIAALPSLLPVILPLIGKALTTGLVKLIIALASGLGGALIATVGAVLLAAIGVSLLYEPIMNFLNWAQNGLLGLAPEWMAGIINGFFNVFKGVINILGGLGDVLIGVFTLNWGKIVDGIVKILGGVVQVITGVIGQITGLGQMIVGAVTSLFSGIANFISNAWANRPRILGGTGGQEPPAEADYAGSGPKTSLSSAIATEQKNKPAGSHLVIANSSETVIPAFKGYTPGGMMGGDTTINFNPTINAGNMDADELAQLMAAKVMEAVQEATYNEVYTS